MRLVDSAKCRLLAFDTRGDGSLGLALTQDVRALGPRQGDRLEPTVQFPDEAAFCDLLSAPHATHAAVFWRRCDETWTRHRNQISDESLGFVFHRVLTTDTLHSLHIGVMLAFYRHCVWFLLSSDIWSGGAKTAEEHVALGV